VRVSVSQLVEFACRSGDLVHTGLSGPSATQGMRAHQRLQREMAQEFEAEVRIRVSVSVDGASVDLGGRIDLLQRAPSLPVIREIKSTLVPPASVPASIQLQHWAQLQVYGYCFLRDAAQSPGTVAPPDSVKLELLWINLLDQQQIIESRDIDFAALERFVLQALRRYLAWQQRVRSMARKTVETAAAMDFPYAEFRSGQRDMAVGTFRAIRDSACLLCEAPTGIGKTLSTLFPALKAVASEHIRQLIYLTAKTPGRTIALEAIRQLEQQGLETSALVLQSKVLICHCSNGTCPRDSEGRCPLTLGFFDRLPAAMDALLEMRIMDGAALDRVATEFQVCPFELSLRMLPWVTVVICDYNYVFDPLVRLTHFAEPDKNMALLLDEAHNLVDRARGMYSARLTRHQSQQVARDCTATHPEVARTLSGLTRALDRWAKTTDAEESATSTTPDTVTRAVDRCVEALIGNMDSGAPLPESCNDWFKELYRYRVIEELFSPQHRTVTRIQQRRGGKDIELRLQCVNAGGWLQKSFSRFRSAVLFSATLRPPDYFHTALGLPAKTRGMALCSPFDASRLGVYICPYIDTRYRARDSSLADLVNLIADVSQSKSGKYLVFFPSYAYMECVHSEFECRYPALDTIIQQRNFTLEQREAFLDRFAAGNAVTGFAIMGGVFGEGVDYLGDRLIGSIIVGTGLPAPGIEQKLIAEDYAAAGLDSFDFAYRYPGFTRVLQTAGRVIRTESDRGVIVLVDGRFDDAFYRALYPQHWDVSICPSGASVNQQLALFWRAE